MSITARNLWRAAQGSNSVVLKRIHKGGVHDRNGLSKQLNYLFNKSESIFGNLVDHDPYGRSLTQEQRAAICDHWSDTWSRSPKNGHTTHLLVSFPNDLSAKKALHIAEEWAANLFQSGETDEWAYIAALHTDRANPHVHIIVNNRGMTNGTWFFMAKDHDFNLADMKESLIQVAAGYGVALDASSRLERGVLTYGPSRAEIEAARDEGRPVREKHRQGRALDDALAMIDRNASTLRVLASFASLASLPEIAAKMEHAAEILSNHGIITPPPSKESNMELDTIRTRRDLDTAFGKWLGETEAKIATLDKADQREMRAEFSKVTSEILSELGDEQGAKLVRVRPRSELYQTQLTDQEVSRNEISRLIAKEASAELRDTIGKAAEAVGIPRDSIEKRLETRAANAWEEREWVKADIRAVAKANDIDLDRAEGRTKAAALVDRFYATAAKSLNIALESEKHLTNERLVRTLGSMAAVLEHKGKVEFENDDHAGRMAEDLKARYGQNVIERIAAGDDRAFATDFPDAAKRRSVARAVVAAAQSHESIGLSLREAERAKEHLAERQELEISHHRRDQDLDL